MRLKPIIFFTVVGALAFLMIYREVSGPGPTLVGAEAPAFELEDAQGRVATLEDYRGKLVFLNLWATWCEPCIREMPDMMAMNRAFEGRPFQMLAISVDTRWSAVEAFYAEYGIDLPTFLDPGRQVYDDYKALGIPETFLIDGNGRILRKYIGPVEWTSPQVMAEVEGYLRQEELRSETSQLGD